MAPVDYNRIIKDSIKSNLPLLLVGNPGIGKTGRVITDVIELRKELKKDIPLWISQPISEDRANTQGFPVYESGTKVAEFVPFGILDRLFTANEFCVLFIDDLGQAFDDVQASYMQILSRNVQGRKIPDCVRFIAATNKRGGTGVNRILEPLKSRFSAIIEVEENADEWLEIASASDWFEPDIASFIRYQPDALMRYEPTADIQTSPNPRVWEGISKWYRIQKTDLLTFEFICTKTLGEQTTGELLAYLRLRDILPDLDIIIADPSRFDPSKYRLNVKCFIAGVLLQRATAKNVTKIIELFCKLPAEVSFFTGNYFVKRNIDWFINAENFSDWANYVVKYL